MEPLAELQLSEMQGLLVSGYGKQKAASFLLLRINDPAAARRWLEVMVERVTYGSNRTHVSKLALAFSFRGLVRLGCPDRQLRGFSREFREGMCTPPRQRILGDLVGTASDPARWLWGGAQADVVDVLLALYEMDTATLHRTVDQHRQSWMGVELVRELPTVAIRETREHFGFRDGFAQPVIRGLERGAAARDLVAPGEFVLGYADETGACEPAPEFARNGSYLVVRQISQDVVRFWSTLASFGVKERVTFAAKMVGRWPDGTPVTLETCPVHPANPTNDFDYGAQNDTAGHRCPIGAHIRRANPRDSLFADPSVSLRLVNRHRLLRRGRPFGRPLPAAAYPPGCVVEAAEGVGVGAPDEMRGLYFACLNASLSRQFEFVQQTWLNNPKFHGLSNETDPLAATQRSSLPGESPVFTLQAAPLRRRLPLPQAFTTTVGGEYFFLPAKNSLAQLAAGMR